MSSLFLWRMIISFSFLDYFDQLFKSYAGNLQVEIVSGLLLIYPNHFVHVIEVGLSLMHLHWFFRSLFVFMRFLLTQLIRWKCMKVGLTTFRSSYQFFQIFEKSITLHRPIRHLDFYKSNKVSRRGTWTPVFKLVILMFCKLTIRLRIDLDIVILVMPF